MLRALSAGAGLWRGQLQAILRDPGVALLLLGAPLLYAFFYPWFYAPQVVQRVPVALVVQDASSLSRQLLRYAQASPRIDPVLVTADEGQARQALLRGQVQGYALIAPDFKRDLLHSAEVVLPVYANGVYPLVAKQVQYGFAEAFGTLSAGVQLKRLQAGGQSLAQASASRAPVSVQLQALFNPTEGYGSFVVAAVAVLILQQTLLMGNAMWVAGWREQGQARAGPAIGWRGCWHCVRRAGWPGCFISAGCSSGRTTRAAATRRARCCCWRCSCPPWSAAPPCSAGGWPSANGRCRWRCSPRCRWPSWAASPGRRRRCRSRCNGCAGSRPAAPASKPRCA